MDIFLRPLDRVSERPFFRLAATPALLLWLTAGCGGPAAPPEARPPEAPAVSRDGASPGPAVQGVADGAGSAPQAKVTEAPRPLDEAALREGWIALFDGSTLFGWEAATEANWRVEEGAMVVDEGPPGLLCTTSTFSDYVLRLEFRSDAGTNSGIFLHTPLQPSDPARDCYELNIAERENPFPTGSLVGRVKADGIDAGQGWQAYEVTVQGGEVRVVLNGETIVEYKDPNPLRRGRIGLQLNEGRVAFRNIALKPLALQSLFNGEDLSGWTRYPDMASEFTVTPEGTLNVRNGRGQLETEDRYADFVLQLECISHAPELNSGIFFRCIPGDVMMGYESQIHNGYEDGDRRKPKDCGTGGIFRRQDARLVVADDQEWFYKTLVADGPHVAVWVNGYQVSDWTDTREPDENPRRGLRTEAGTIMIQGHDPGTNLSFRNLRIAELAPREE